VSFFNDVSSEMIYPLLPLFVVALGASATSLGWVEGVAQAAVALVTAWAGWHSDRFRRRVPYVRVGYGLPVAGKGLLVAATGWPLVMAARAIDRAGKGIRNSPRDALIADTTPPELRGRAFGLHRAMDSAGAVVGVLASAALLYHFADSTSTSGFRTVFAIAAVLGLAALGCTLFLREAPHDDTPATAGDGPLPRRFWIVLVLLGVFSIANSSDTFLLLRAGQVGLPPYQVVLAYALFSFVYMLLSYPAGLASDRIGRWPVIAIGWLIYAGVYAGIAVTGATGIWPLLAIYGAYIALTDGVGKALLTDHVPKARRGFALGLFYTTTAGTTLASSVVAGLLWDRVSPAAPFWFGSITAGAAVALLAILRPWRG
jgi:MFS family permease